MDTQQIITAIDDEIQHLTQVRSLLSREGSEVRGGKRVLSPEARQRIVDAQRRRWAKAKKSAK